MERRKLATQDHIARVAAELFSLHGSSGTTVELICDQAEVGVRTFYRYFRTKQDAVAPLLASGADRWLQLLAGMSADVPLRDAIERATRDALVDCDVATLSSYEWTRGLLRAAKEDPALRAVWLRVNDDSEQHVSTVLAERAGARLGEFGARLLAAQVTAALRVAVETWAQSDTPAEDAAEAIAALAADAVRTASSGLGGSECD
ncbi:TetR family transcriptional regulator [Mycobacteroides salmoniphilum]|uniref:TetR family transcriptional regulator n=1 Tax=Mycobacteroides salmoniphilum TaxID=404941 RepID=UPI00099265B7|nr:TetR family transcriptional regulator [Mycobacteroides salmoniphilum]